MSQLFQGTPKPIIGMVQPPALPGTAGWNRRPFKEILDFALTDAQNLIQGGVDAICVQDLWDGPTSEIATPEIVTYMTIITHEIRKFTLLPLGVSLIANDAPANFAIAAATNADFVRLKVFVGIMLKGSGMITGCAADALAYRQHLGCEHITICADVHDRSGTVLGNVPLRDDVEGAVWSRADSLIITGRSTEESLAMLKDARQVATDLPIIIGGGTNVKNLNQILPLVDGVIVGATLKRNGNDPEPVDVERVRNYMSAVNAVRDALKH